MGQTSVQNQQCEYQLMTANKIFMSESKFKTLLEEEKQQTDPQYQVQLYSYSQYILFFNPGSGGERATQLNELDVPITKNQQMKSKQFTSSHSVIYTVHFANLTLESSRTAGLQRLSQLTQETKENTNVRVVIGGGDGTIMWAIECILGHHIDIQKCVIVPFPFGTGNDFSNALGQVILDKLGWGVSVPDDILGPRDQVMLSYLQMWHEQSLVMYFDIWDVDFMTLDNGSFQKIMKNGNRLTKQTLVNDRGSPRRQYTKRMSNYFSVGIDARVGLGFDRNRTGSRCCNKCVYCWEGFKKMFIKTRRINEVIEGFSPYEVKHRKSAQLEAIQAPLNGSKTTQSLPTIEGNPVTLVCLNINSYSGGVRDIWKNGNSAANNKQTMQTSFSDGMLEFLTFNSLIGIANERFYGGNAQRVAQGGGPFTLTFKESNDDLITFFQVDGEYFQVTNNIHKQVTNPQKVEIRPCSELLNGKVKVLVHNPKI